MQSYHMLIAQTEAEELPTVSVNPYFTFGSVTKAVSEMKQHLNEFSNEELVKVAKAGGQEGSGGGRTRVNVRAHQLCCLCSEQNDLLPAGRVQKASVCER